MQGEITRYERRNDPDDELEGEFSENFPRTFEFFFITVVHMLLAVKYLRNFQELSWVHIIPLCTSLNIDQVIKIGSTNFT